MLRVAPRLAQFGLLSVVLWTVGCPGFLGPHLNAGPIAFHLQAALNTDVLNIANTGGGALTWSTSTTPAWLTLSPTSGNLGSSELQPVTLTIDRTGLATGTYTTEFLVSSNAGSQTVAVAIEVSGPTVPTLSVASTALDFGAVDTTRAFTVRNIGTGTLNWSAASDQTWLTLAPTSDSTATETDTVTATAVRTGLSAGLHTATITVTSDAGNATVSVTLTVPGPVPALAVNPATLDFGSQTTTQTLTVTNTGTGSLDWTLTEAIPWLSVSSASGSTTTTSTAITVTVDRSALSPGTFNGTLSFSSNGGAIDVPVQMTVSATQLVVTPLTLIYGNFSTNKLFTIANGGIGTVTWNINTAGLPAWLTLSPTSGNVTTTPQGVLAAVDRTGLAPGNYTQDVVVTSNAGSATVTINMSVAVVPVLTVESGLTTIDGRPIVALGDEATTTTFTIRNTGTGSLDWNLDPALLPSWLTISPVSGSVTTQTNTITATVSRAGQGVGAYSHDVPISSNGGTVVVEVSMVVPLRASIGTDLTELDFGLDADVGEFNVANFGDVGTILNFAIQSDKVWLFNSPSTGSSIGVSSPPPFKDWRKINVSVDRGSLESVGSKGTFTISAVDNTGAVIPDITPRTVTISVEANPLSFEQAEPRTRIPSLVQYILLLRDFRDRAIQVTPAQAANAFQIFESGVPLEATETNQFVTSGANLKTNLVFMLDYSGSMLDAVQGLGLAGADQLQAAYEQAGDGFLNGLPAFYRMALMEFHDRSQATQLVQDFTTDKPTILTALQGITISDHGATALLPAVDSATVVLRDEDRLLLPFDNADVRALVLISDGRRTTPPGVMQDTIDFAVANRVRIFAVGWGKEINNEPLARLASATGGHYYPTRGDANGDPTLAELEDRLQTVADDLASQIVLTYVTLAEASNTPVRVNTLIDNPNDNPDQGELEGTFQYEMDLDLVAGDTKMGQLSLRSTPVIAGAASVTLRADYIPRNVNKFQFTFSSTQAFTVAKISAANGGLVEGWTLTDLGGGVFALTSPTTADVLPYGSFGNLLTIDFAAVGATPFVLSLTVDNTIYSADIEPKYFLYPDTITVDTTDFFAPAFPTADVTPTSIALGTALNSAALNISNFGGSYPYGGATSLVQLNWEIASTPTFITANPKEGTQNTTVGADTVTLTADRTDVAGDYSGTVIVTYTGNALNIGNAIAIPITMTILPPVLAVNTNALDFGAATTDLTFNITNTGQSTLAWSITTNAFPAWLTLNPSSGTTTFEQDTITLTVDRTGLASGPYTHVFTVDSTNGGTQTITVDMTVP